MTNRPRFHNLLRHGLVGGALLGAAAGPATANPCDDRGASTAALVLGVQLSPGARLIGGAEVRHCLNERTEVLGRLELGGGAPRLIMGARVRPFERANQTDDSELLGLEAAAILDTHARFGGHLAGTFGAKDAYLAVQTDVTLSGPARPARWSLLAGLSPTALNGPAVVDGRPLAAGDRWLVPAVVGASTARGELAAVHAHFQASAQFEYSSVWTFLRLAAELAAVGAPAALVAAALDAADDEVRHAELCAQAAGGIALAPLPAPLAQPRFTRRTPAALATLAVEAWREGCLNEGAASLEAAWAGAAARGAIASTLAGVAVDEAGHAELSWAVLAWVASVDATALADLDRPARTVGEASLVDARDLAWAGVPSTELRVAALAQATAAAHRRRAAALS
ncbi:MAG: hypothetical protein R3B06_01030 [Kofleriaceae bacterium]